MKSVHLFFILVLLYADGYGQSASYYFKNYQVNNGLSSNTITTILQDKKGFMWFGSRNGLNRFDGNVFKVFNNKLADTTSIGSNSIFSLYEDSREHLWVGTYKGIYVYDPVTEKFSPFKLIPPGEVRYIKGDNDHHIWIVSDLNLYKYDELRHKMTSFKLSGDQIITIRLSGKGTLWAATAKGFLRKYDAGTDKVTNYDMADYNSGKKLSAIQEIYAVGDTALLLGTMNQALLFNYKALRLKNVFNNRQALKDVHVHVIFRQSDGNYWLGTENGLCIFDIKTGDAAIVQKQYSNPYSITDNIISAIYKDKEGGTWIGTYFGGVNYYSGQYNNFKKYFPEPGVNSISGNIVHEITKDKYGKLWVGTEDAGLNRIDLKTGSIRRFLPDHTPGSITYRNIHGIVADDDKLWIGTYEHGLDVMDLKTLKVIKHYNAGKNATSFASDFIVCIYKTKAGGILIGTWNGLFKYDRAGDNFSAVPFFNMQIQSIHEDAAGTLWVSSYGRGVYYQNEKTGISGHLNFQPGKPGGLLNNYVNGLFEDSKKNLWFCTEGGLSKYQPVTRRITNYTTENGLTDNQVFRVLEDENGILWISTAKGLSRFDPAKASFTGFHTVNGLPTEQFNYNSAYRDTDGTLYFGTVKGMISFEPAKFTKNAFIPPVYITGLQVNNKDVEIGAAPSALTRSITYTNKITLPYDGSSLSIDVASLSFVIPEMNRYEYKMEGNDKSWTQLKNNRKIYYTNLPSGSYTFKVKGSNSEGAWNSKETRLEITILPPFWATTWAYIFYMAVVAAVTGIIIRYYHLAVSEKNKRKIETIKINTEREIYNAKINFFTNVAHEIRTPLTLIKMPLDKLISSRFDDADIIESLNMMKKNTNRLIDLTDQLLDFRKAEANNFSLNFTKTDINELVTDVYSVFKPAADQKNIGFKLELPRITLHAFVDNEALKKILSNLFNNAVKYAAARVNIKLLPFSSEDTEFTIEVRNDGFIIPPELKDKIFEPFYRIKETEKEAGAGIGLPLSRSLAQLHKGSIVLKTAADVNIFLLSLPIHQEKEMNFTGLDEEVLITGTENSGTIRNENNNGQPLILLVEDNFDILNYVSNELSAKYAVLKATNGMDALKLLQEENIQLVISDIMMPVMDGIELCKKMKTDLQYSHVPIILLTAKNSLNSKIEGLEVGADAYIEKPFAFEYLLAQINSLLSNRNIIKEYFARSPLTHMKGIACSKADKDFLEHLNKTIYDQITDIELDVDKLSAMMNMSRPTLYRKIKGLSDLTPNELINLTRLKKAAELLAEGNYKINEVANLIGYSMPTNFSRDFQRQFGVSPSAYLNALKN